jgi:hypothetical protein
MSVAGALQFSSEVPRSLGHLEARPLRFNFRFGPISYLGILAFAIGKMDGVGGRKGWEW